MAFDQRVKEAIKYYISAFVCVVWAEMLMLLTLWRGVGGLSQNADMLTVWREEVGEFNNRASIAAKYFKLSMS